MPKGNDLTGLRFGKLLAAERLEERGDRYYSYRCLCDCGNEIIVNTKRLLRGTVQGCEQCWEVRSNRAVNHAGKRYGSLLVLRPSPNRKHGRYTWVCQCDCGKLVEVTAHDLVNGTTTSCGCRRIEAARNLYRDLRGQKIGMLQVIERTGNTDSKGSLLWRCKCECGNECIYSADQLIHGHIVSCGCYRKNELSKLLPTRMHFIDGTCVEFLRRKKRRDNTSGYETTKGATPAAYPAETLSFAVTAAQGNPDDTMISIANYTVSGITGNVSIVIPSYSKVGRYNYSVKETAGSTQGVTYASTEFGVQVLVTYNDAGTALVAQTSFTTESDDCKVDEIINNYDLGSLTVTKEVTGNLGSKTQKFDIDVTFTAEGAVLSTITGAATITPADWTDGTATVTVSLADGETATFSNVPAGVTYTVAEQAKHTTEDPNGSNPATGYTVSYEDEEGTIAADTTAAATVTNTKGAEIATGVTTDSLPYIVLLGVVALIGAAMLLKRRTSEN